MPVFQVKTKTVHGENSLSYLKQIKNKRIWIICDPFLANGEGMQLLTGQLDASNHLSIFSDVVPDPPIAQIAKGVTLAQDNKAEVMIAFGGGSAIDTAKGIYYFSKKRDNLLIEQFIAIPTTSGTGSEVTQATVISDPVTKVKYPLFNEEMIPDVAILDPALCVTVPPAITANTGLDVLAHAIEAYVSTGATNYTDALAEKSTYLAFMHLVPCYNNGIDLKHRDGMHDASTLAGMAFNCSNLGMNHSIAHQLGVQFDLPHGLANAMLLGPVMKFNAAHSQKAKEKYVRLAKICGIAHQTDSMETGIRLLDQKITEIMRQMGVAKTLTEAGISTKQVLTAMDEMVTNTLKDACFATNPVCATRQDIENIIQTIM